MEVLVTDRAAADGAPKMQARRSGLWPIVAAVLVVATLSAQAPRPAFEVVSIKRGAGVGQSVRQGSIFRLGAATVLGLIQFAYDLRAFQVIGGPQWMREDLFEVNARAGASDVSQAERRLMVQSLLADRFRLVSRLEKREMAFFALLTMRPDGSPGPYLHRVVGQEECRRAQQAERDKARPKPVTISAMVTFCGDLSALASGVSRSVPMPVFDRTGLTGMWMADVYFDSGPVAASTQQPAARDPLLVPIEIALQEQLGLRLEPTRGSVDVVVVESVQQPTEN
jgi:uncharacterized protein (TIGR03435 family)